MIGSYDPSAQCNIPFVAGGRVFPHFDEVSLRSAMQAPFFNRLYNWSDENQADNQSPPHDQALVR
jgi:hypothetical protein